MLLLLNGKDGLMPALLMFVLPCHVTEALGLSPISAVSCDNVPTFKKEPVNYDPLNSNNQQACRERDGLLASLFVFAFECILLLLCGDIHTNPGPNNLNQLDNSIITAMHLNINSLRNKTSILEAEASKYDIITISETWLNENINNDSIFLAGFHPPVRNDRPDGWGGVAIFMKSKLVCKARPDMHIPGLDAVWVETKLDQDTLLVCSLYRPPDSLVNYWKLIDDSIKQAVNTPHRFIILGDFNSDPWIKESPQLINIIEQNNLFQLVEQPTRITGTSSRCIDLILTSSKEHVHSVTVLPPICSDHCVPLVELKCKTRTNAYIKKPVFNYSKINVDRLQHELNNVDFTEIITNNTLDVSARLFSEKLMDAAKLCMPFRTVKIRENSPPWLNDYILILREQKNVTHIVAKRLNTPEAWEEFRKVRNFYTDEIRNRKKYYLSEVDRLISNNENFGQKHWWRLVNAFLKNKGINSDSIPPLEHHNRIIYENADKANIFNTYFNEQAKVSGEDDPLPNIPQSNHTLLPFSLTENEITLTIKGLDVNKAVGPDLVHNRILKAACPIIIKPLTKLFNKSLTEGLFPEVWKTAYVTPIYKKGEKSLCKNYRPISLLSCVGKLLEKCVQKHLLIFLEDQNVITVSQSGFTRGDSTIYQLLNIYDDFVKALDEKVSTQAIFFDVSKAFDRVWHRGLIHKLEAIGIRGSLLLWFRDYLTDRKQAVVVKGSKSTFLNISAGVPQGSVLGPTLFLIYINDLNNEIESITKLFADDTSMYLSLNDDQTRNRILNSDIQKISRWAESWKVTFNCQKTELLNICRQNIVLDNRLTFDGSQLQPTNLHKHLGLIIQDNCKWDSHINSLISKCRPLVSCLKSFKYRLSRKSLETMYKSFIMPHFDYADVVWDNLTQLQAESLEQIQLDALRTIIGTVRGTSHEKIYQEAGFIPLKFRRERHKLVLFFKFVNQLLPDHIITKFPNLVSEVNPYPRRRPLERQLPPWSTDLYYKSYFPSTTLLWNDLPDDIKSTTSIGAFKRYLSRNDPIVPYYFYSGNRLPQIIHCKLRLKMSDLNSDMFSRHLTNDKSCRCGAPNEDATHYLLNCTKYTEIRNTTIRILPPLAQNLKTLLFGNTDFSIAFNEYIVLTVHEFICLSNRFELQLT